MRIPQKHSSIFEYVRDKRQNLRKLHLQKQRENIVSYAFFFITYYRNLLRRILLPIAQSRIRVHLQLRDRRRIHRVLHRLEFHFGKHDRYFIIIIISFLIMTIITS